MSNVSSSAMLIVNQDRRLFAAKARQIHEDHILYGLTSTALAGKYGLSPHTVEGLLRRTPSVLDVGAPPAECKLGKFKRFREIIEPVLRKYGVNWSQFMGESRRSRLKACRWEAWFLLWKDGYQFIRIGEFCGRDHSTIVHAVRKLEAIELEDKAAAYWGA
jgi:hypothetical protein